LTTGGGAGSATDDEERSLTDAEAVPPTDVGASEAGSTLRRLTSLFGPPFIAMAVAWATIAYRSPYSGSDLFSPSSFARWDSGQYIRIARLGYHASWNCHAKMLPVHMPPGDYLCGNTGWFPGYPAAMRVVSSITSMSIPTTGLVISWVC